MGILCKMNTDQNYMEFFCKFFCWRSLINLEGNSFIKYKREIFTKDFLVKKIERKKERKKEKKQNNRKKEIKEK